MNMMTGIVWGETEDQTHLPRYYRRGIWVQQEEEDLQRPQHQSRSENAPWSHARIAMSDGCAVMGLQMGGIPLNGEYMQLKLMV